jgi:TRAP-type mannitol/chloroaromatic compound transport system permease small subunit
MNGETANSIGGQTSTTDIRFQKALKVIDAISRWSGKITGFLIYPGIGILVYEVIMRYAFHSPTLWAHGASQRIFGTYFIICGAYGLLVGAHVNMDLIINRVSTRTKGILNVIACLFFFIFIVVIIWQGSRFAWMSLSGLENDNTPWAAPMYPVKLMIPLGGFLILLQGIAKFSRDIMTIISRRQ